MLAAVVAYFVVIGGSSAGEQLTAVRLLNAVVGAALVGSLIVRVGREHDRVDTAVMIGVVLFAATALFSSNQRLSLDSALQVLAYAGVFWYARGVLAREAAYRALVWTFGALCIGLAAFYAIEWGGVWLEWGRLTEFREVPPLSLPLPGGLYLHRHDVVLLVVMLVPALFIPIGFGRLALARALAIALLTVMFLIDGSRTVMLAVAASGGVALLLTATRHRRTWLRMPLDARQRFVAVGLALVVVAVLVVIAAPLGARLLALQPLAHRTALWSAAAELWLSDPLTGSGPGTFLVALYTTGYYDYNIFFPRNTDGGLAMLAAETGLLGAAAILSPAVALVRQRTAAARPGALLLFAPMAFIFAGMGSVPADFAYLIVPALLWSAAAYPRITTGRQNPVSSRRLSPITYASVGCALGVAVSIAVTAAAGFAYETARAQAARGDLEMSAQNFERAARLDAKFALYWRALAAVQLAEGHADEALTSLDAATASEPRDPVTERLRAASHLETGDVESAVRAAAAAVDLHATESVNQVMAARATAEAQKLGVARGHVRLAVLQHPWLLAMPWDGALAEVEPTKKDAEAALHAWATSPQAPAVGLEPAWLRAMVGAKHHADATAAAAAGFTATVRALDLLFECRPDLADAALENAAIAERAHGSYWAVRIVVDRLLGHDDSKHVGLGRITGLERGVVDGIANSPLLEMWGYRRLPLPSIQVPIELPSGEVAFRQWVADPVTATREVGATPLAECAAAERTES